MATSTVVCTQSPTRTGLHRPVFFLVLASAVVLIFLRLLAPFEVGVDQATQIEAGLRFATGSGVSTTNSIGGNPDIVQSSEPKPVTWWPPGFSIVLGGLLAAGVPLLAALKLLFSAATLAGWAGWAALAQKFLVPLKIGKRTYPVHLVVAACLPLILTPRWSRSDPFLWAGVPVLIILLARRPGAAAWRYYAAAGGLLGMLLTIRYAAAFLVPVAAFMLIQYSWPSLKALVGRTLIFTAAAVLFVIPLVWYLHGASEATGRELVPGVATAGGDAIREASTLTAIKWVMDQSPAVWTLFPGLALLASATARLESTEITMLVGTAGFLAVLSLPLAARRLNAGGIAVSLATVPVALVVFLAIVNKGLFFAVRRYYDPAIPAVVLLIFAIAACPRLSHVSRLLATAACSFATLYFVAFLPAVLLWPGQRVEPTVQTVLGYTPVPAASSPAPTVVPVRYPSPFLLYGQKEQTRRRMFELNRAHPDALWFVEHYSLFVYDSVLQPDAPRPGITIRPLPPPSYWRNAFTSRNVRIFVVLHNSDYAFFIPKSERHIIYENKSEESKIVTAEFPAGHHFKVDISDQPVEAPIE